MYLTRAFLQSFDFASSDYVICCGIYLKEKMLLSTNVKNQQPF